LHPERRRLSGVTAAGARPERQIQLLHCFGRNYDGSRPERRLLSGVTATGARPERRIQRLRERSCRAGRCARCDDLGAAGLTACPRRLSLGRFVLAPLRESSLLVRHPIQGYARVREAALNAPPLCPLRTCGASAAVARLSCDACSAIARPGVQDGIDVGIFPSASGFAPKAPFPGRKATCTSGFRVFTQLSGCDPDIYPARRTAQACAAAPPLFQDALRCQGREACICESLMTEIILERESLSRNSKEKSL
jgi:hypothetical protein